MRDFDNHRLYLDIIILESLAQRNSTDSMSDVERPPGKKTTSTLLDGRHVFPPFYACYLLRSKATPNSNRTYVRLQA